MVTTQYQHKLREIKLSKGLPFFQVALLHFFKIL